MVNRILRTSQYEEVSPDKTRTRTLTFRHCEESLQPIVKNRGRGTQFASLHVQAAQAEYDVS